MIFTKMHGLGNDYVCINCFRERVEDPPGFARTLCDRHYGIGADGLILICPSKVSDFKMEIYNSDGSVAGCAAMASDAWENMYMITDLPERKRSVSRRNPEFVTCTFIFRMGKPAVLW